MVNVGNNGMYNGKNHMKMVKYHVFHAVTFNMLAIKNTDVCEFVRVVK